MDQRQIKYSNFIFIIFSIIALLLPPELATAAPPFNTVDPVPEPFQHIDIYLFSLTDRMNKNLIAQTPALATRYGLAPNFEINSTIPFVFNISQSRAQSSEYGLGDLQFGVVYRFVQETPYLPQIAFAPTFSVPTGDANRALGNGRTTLALPIALQKSWGKWEVYGNGGYLLNGAPTARNSFFGGMVLQRNCSDQLSLGGEIFYQGATSNTILSTTILNFGGNYNVTKNLSILFSAGHSIIGANNFVTYAGLNWSY